MQKPAKPSPRVAIPAHALGCASRQAFLNGGYHCLGLMLDIGRVAIPLAELERVVHAMHSEGFTLLHLHFSENTRFGLEAPHAPGLAAADALSQHDLDTLKNLAARLGIELMGEIGMPGHMGRLLDWHATHATHAAHAAPGVPPIGGTPLWVVDDQGQAHRDALDIAHPAALEFCLQWLRWGASVVGGSRWHLGGDEWLSPAARKAGVQGMAERAVRAWGGASLHEARLRFTNALVAEACRLGLEPHAWGDDLAPQTAPQMAPQMAPQTLGDEAGPVANERLDPRVVVEWWSETSPLDGRPLPGAGTYASMGHQLVNCSWRGLYRVAAPTGSESAAVQKLQAVGFGCEPDLDWLRNRWHPAVFQGSLHATPEVLQGDARTAVVGCKLQVWADEPRVFDATALAEDLTPWMRTMAHAAVGVASLRAAALEALAEQDPEAKSQKVAAIQAFAPYIQTAETPAHDDGPASLPVSRPIPGRPERPLLRPPHQVPRRDVRTPEGRACLLHALAHIEFNAINLALDALWRFDNMPLAYYTDWLGVAQDEALHFGLLCEHMASLGHRYGDFLAHNSLWEMAERTAHDVLARMALVPRTLEARGLDASPPIRERLRSMGDHKGAAILQRILDDEVGHVAVGNRWFRWCCSLRGLDPIAAYAQLAAKYRAPAPRPPFNLEARRAAGFTEQELALLGAPVATQR